MPSAARLKRAVEHSFRTARLLIVVGKVNRPRAEEEQALVSYGAQPGFRNMYGPLHELFVKLSGRQAPTAYDPWALQEVKCRSGRMLFAEDCQVSDQVFWNGFPTLNVAVYCGPGSFDYGPAHLEHRRNKVALVCVDPLDEDSRDSAMLRAFFTVASALEKGLDVCFHDDTCCQLGPLVAAAFYRKWTKVECEVRDVLFFFIYNCYF